MRIEDYPPQEPFTPVGARYHAEALRLGEGLAGEELSYGSDPYQGLLLFHAPRPTGETLLFLHGGGWTNGYKEWVAFMAPALNAAGVNLACAGYRLAPQHLYPAGLEDSAAAVQATARALPGTRLFVGGHSAGGHYAALLALMPERLGGVALAGCLPVSGVYDFGPHSGLTMRPRFLGPEGNGMELAASPIGHIRPGAPPFLLAWGERDFPHLIPQAEAFAAGLRAAGIAVETVMLPGCDHLQASYEAGKPDGAWLLRALAWMRAAG